MAGEMDNRNFGDSAKTKHQFELDLKNSNHVFDGAGENIQYHSDSESVGSRQSKTRYINPAIYVEQVEATHSASSLHSSSRASIEDSTPHPHGTYRSSSTPYLTGRVSSPSLSGSTRRKSCRLPDAEGPAETPRDERTYREDGHDTFRLSVASLSTTTTANEERERNERKKQEAFKQWVARKEEEKRERARLEKLKQQPTPQTSAEQREESYRHWVECKRKQQERKKAEEVMRRFRAAQREENERKKREREKEDKLQEWNRKKEEEMKSMKTKEERKAARVSTVEERRRSMGEKAYRDWLRTSRNKPLPVPLNQGELSMRGSVSQMYINPIPWQSPI